MKTRIVFVLMYALIVAFFLVWNPSAQASTHQVCVTPDTYVEKVKALHDEDGFTVEPVFTGRGEISAFLELYPMKSDRHGVPNGFWLVVNTTHGKALIIPTIDGCLLAYRNLNTKPETLAMTLHSGAEWEEVRKNVEVVLRRSRV